MDWLALWQCHPYVMTARQRVTTATRNMAASPTRCCPLYVNGLLLGQHQPEKLVAGCADVAKNIAVKAQYDCIRPDHGSAAGLLISSDSKPLSSIMWPRWPWTLCSEEPPMKTRIVCMLLASAERCRRAETGGGWSANRPWPR